MNEMIYICGLYQVKEQQEIIAESDSKINKHKLLIDSGSLPHSSSHEVNNQKYRYPNYTVNSEPYHECPNLSYSANHRAYRLFEDELRSPHFIRCIWERKLVCRKVYCDTRHFGISFYKKLLAFE